MPWSLPHTLVQSVCDGSDFTCTIVGPVSPLKKNRRRLKFEQWILLAVRCLVLALVGTALARPFGCQQSTIASLAGSLWVIALTAVIAIPLGVSAALYLESQFRLVELGFTTGVRYDRFDTRSDLPGRLKDGGDSGHPAVTRRAVGLNSPTSAVAFWMIQPMTMPATIAANDATPATRSPEAKNHTSNKIPATNTTMPSFRPRYRSPSGAACFDPEGPP